MIYNIINYAMNTSTSFILFNAHVCHPLLRMSVLRPVYTACMQNLKCYEITGNIFHAPICQERFSTPRIQTLMCLCDSIAFWFLCTCKYTWLRSDIRRNGWPTLESVPKICADILTRILETQQTWAHWVGWNTIPESWSLIKYIEFLLMCNAVHQENEYLLVPCAH